MLRENDSALRRVVYNIPSMEQVAVRKDLVYKAIDDMELAMDVYYPRDYTDGTSRPAVLYIHGDGPPEMLEGIKDAGQYVGWGQLAAASGLIGVTANHRSTERRTKLPAVAQDADDLVAYVRANAADLRIDGERLCLWSCSGGPPAGLRTALRDTPAYVRCIVSYYGMLCLRLLREHVAPSVSDDVLREFSPASYLRDNADRIAPFLLARAGRDHPHFNTAADVFIAEALAANITIEILNHPTGQHAFDILDDDGRSREIIARTLAFMAHHLSAGD